MLAEPFGLQPDGDSTLVLFETWVERAVIRDNWYVGAKHQTDSVNHTATAMVPLWGRAKTVDYICNSGQDVRITMYAKVAPNLTVTDHIVRDTHSVHTRFGLSLSNEPTDGKLSLVVTVENTTIVGARKGLELMATCGPSIHHSCQGPAAGGIAIDGLAVSGVETAMSLCESSTGRPQPSRHVVV